PPPLATPFPYTTLFRSPGAELILCDIDGIALTHTAERLSAFARFCDSIEDNSVAILAAEIAEKYSSIDVLINAAGRGYDQHIDRSEEHTSELQSLAYLV